MRIEQDLQIAGTWCYVQVDAYVDIDGEVTYHDLLVDGEKPTHTMRELAEEAIYERYEAEIWAEEEEYNRRTTL